MIERLTTGQGIFKCTSTADENSVTLTGTVKLAGQVYEISLTLWRGENGWQRRTYEDLVVTKVGGPNDGKPGRPVAREYILGYLPEEFNTVIGDS